MQRNGPGGVAGSEEPSTGSCKNRVCRREIRFDRSSFQIDVDLTFTDRWRRVRYVATVFICSRSFIKHRTLQLLISTARNKKEGWSMLFAGLLIALLTISASTSDVERPMKARDGNLAEAPLTGAATLASGHEVCNLNGRQDTLFRYISRYFNTYRKSLLPNICNLWVVSIESWNTQMWGILPARRKCSDHERLYFVS